MTSSNKWENTEVHFLELVRVVANGPCVELPGGRSEMSSATETVSNVNPARTPGQVKHASHTTETYG